MIDFGLLYSLIMGFVILASLPIPRRRWDNTAYVLPFLAAAAIAKGVQMAGKAVSQHMAGSKAKKIDQENEAIARAHAAATEEGKKQIEKELEDNGWHLNDINELKNRSETISQRSGTSTTKKEYKVYGPAKEMENALLNVLQGNLITPEWSLAAKQAAGLASLAREKRGQIASTANQLARAGVGGAAAEDQARMAMGVTGAEADFLAGLEQEKYNRAKEARAEANEFALRRGGEKSTTNFSETGNTVTTGSQQTAPPIEALMRLRLPEAPVFKGQAQAYSPGSTLFSGLSGVAGAVGDYYGAKAAGAPTGQQQMQQGLQNWYGPQSPWYQTPSGPTIPRWHP